MSSRLIQILILGSLTIVVLAVIALAILSLEPAWLPEFAPKEEAYGYLAYTHPCPHLHADPNPSSPNVYPNLNSHIYANIHPYKDAQSD